VLPNFRFFDTDRRIICSPVLLSQKDIVNPGKWHELRIVAEKSHLRCWQACQDLSL